MLVGLNSNSSIQPKLAVIHSYFNRLCFLQLNEKEILNREKCLHIKIFRHTNNKNVRSLTFFEIIYEVVFQNHSRSFISSILFSKPFIIEHQRWNVFNGDKECVRTQL